MEFLRPAEGSGGPQRLQRAEDGKGVIGVMALGLAFLGAPVWRVPRPGVWGGWVTENGQGFRALCPLNAG